MREREIDGLTYTHNHKDIYSIDVFISGNFLKLSEFISKSAEFLAKNASHLDNVIASLDCQKYSFGILGILQVFSNFLLKWFSHYFHWLIFIIIQVVFNGVYKFVLKWFMKYNVFLSHCRCVKYNLSNIPDFETLYVQTQEFIFNCNGEHVRNATSNCKYLGWMKLVKWFLI